MKLLTAVDFSTASEAVLEAAKIYAKKLNAEIFLIHVEPAEAAFTGEYGVGSLYEKARDIKTEHVRLQKEAKALENDGLNVTPILLKGSAGEAIVAEAKRLEADLIIIGSHGHGVLRMALVGSTSESVLRKAKIPVLVIPV